MAKDNSIHFVKPRISFLSWLKELKSQLTVLLLYQRKDYKVLYQMRKKIYSKAIEQIKKAKYIRVNSKDMNSREKQKCREETEEIMLYLHFQEEAMNDEYEMYRRGSKDYKKRIEEKWLKNVADKNI